jgi:hypothetical protein
MKIRRSMLSIAVLALVAGCAFDIVSVKQTPTTLGGVRTPALDFVLTQDAAVSIGTGFPTRLKQGTHWQSVGVIDQGAVYSTKDQVVTVEASNISEAQIVVSHGELVGFYLPVERTFAAAKNPVLLQTKPIQ